MIHRRRHTSCLHASLTSASSSLSSSFSRTPHSPAWPWVALINRSIAVKAAPDPPSSWPAAASTVWMISADVGAGAAGMDSPLNSSAITIRPGLTPETCRIPLMTRLTFSS